MFLYNAKRHRQSIYGRQRLCEHAINGDFDLEHIKGSMKSKYKIWGGGTHPIQQLLKKYDMHELMRGHLVEVNDKTLAVWMKLNYDLIGKPGTEYRGMFTDLDINEIQPLLEQTEALNKNKIELTKQLGRLRTMQSHTETFLKYEFTNVDPSVCQSLEVSREELVQSYTKLDIERDWVSLQIKTLKDKAEAYLANNKVG